VFAPVSMVEETDARTKPVPTPSLPPPAQPASAAPTSKWRSRDQAGEWARHQGRREHRAGCAGTPAGRRRWRPLVITVPAGVRIYLACGATDMRKGFDSLSVMAREVLKEDPYTAQNVSLRYLAASNRNRVSQVRGIDPNENLEMTPHETRPAPPT
jgi:transposase